MNPEIMNEQNGGTERHNHTKAVPWKWIARLHRSAPGAGGCHVVARIPIGLMLLVHLLSQTLRVAVAPASHGPAYATTF
jgi:hypothetical protein